MTAAQRQTAAADAAVELVAQAQQLGDARVEKCTPRPAQSGPVSSCRIATVRQEGERLSDFGKSQSETLRGSDESHPAERAALVATLVCRSARGADQAERLVVPGGRDGDVRPIGQLT